MATKTELKVRYHYWEFGGARQCNCGCGWSEDAKLYRDRPTSFTKVGDNPFTRKVIEFLDKNFHFQGKYRPIIVAEDMNTGEFGYAILHPIDEDNGVFNKKLGRKIALGRLKKRLGLKTK